VRWRELQLAASASADDSTSRTQKGAIHKKDAPMLDITKDIQSDAEAYHRLLDIAALADPREGIRQGLEDARDGKTRPVREFLAEFTAKHGIPR
jgi:hypothetical protein